MMVTVNKVITKETSLPRQNILNPEYKITWGFKVRDKNKC